MAKKQKYYVVWEGNRPGIYTSWEECKLQITGYPGAKYKAFKSQEEAQEAYQSSYEDHIGGKEPKKRKTEIPKDANIVWNSLSVDAACSGNPGDLEYRGVDTKSGEELFKQGPFKKGTNNIGEFLAIVHALALLQKQGKNKLPIYSDSRTAMLWVKNKKANTKLKEEKINVPLFKLIRRAEKWLKTHPYHNPIYKWDTDAWGEIPADFGRK